MSAPAGWYADPDHPEFARWWDGRRWTGHRQTLEADTGPLDEHVAAARQAPPAAPDARGDAAGTALAPSGHPAPAVLAHDADLRHRLPAHALLAKLAELDALGLFAVPGRRRSYVHDEALPWYRGALGERRMARLLSALGPEWTVLHSVPIGRGDGDVDHVAIGPPGVFSINTKRHPGKAVWVGGRTAMVAGQRVHHVTASAHEARRVSALLSQASGIAVAATGIVALVDAGRVTVRTRPEFPDVAVAVLRAEDVRRFLLGGRRAHSDEEVRRIAEAAASASTWRASPRRENGVAELSARLDAGRRSAGAVVERAEVARRRRRAAGLALAIALAATAAVVLLDLPAIAGLVLRLLGVG